MSRRRTLSSLSALVAPPTPDRLVDSPAGPARIKQGDSSAASSEYGTSGAGSAVVSSSSNVSTGVEQPSTASATGSIVTANDIVVDGAPSAASSGVAHDVDDDALSESDSSAIQSVRGASIKIKLKRNRRGLITWGSVLFEDPADEVLATELLENVTMLSNHQTIRSDALTSLTASGGVARSAMPAMASFELGDPNVDLCVGCGVGGELVCCDTCPAAFHLECTGLKQVRFNLSDCLISRWPSLWPSIQSMGHLLVQVPEGDWSCPLCTGERTIESYRKASDPNVDRCVACTGQGELLCCDTCPAAFHMACTGLKQVMIL